ncbi:ATP/GTP-binding protein, partial [Streptomyces sp. NPDC049577]
MDTEGMTEGAHDARRTRPRPAPPPPSYAPPPPPHTPPPPSYAPAARPALAAWLDTPRRPGGPGVWRYGHVPVREPEAERVPDRALLS